MSVFYKSHSVGASGATNYATDLTLPRPVDTLVLVGDILYRSTNATVATYTSSWTYATGDALTLQDDSFLYLGTDSDFSLSFVSATPALTLQGASPAAGASPSIIVDTGDSVDSTSGSIVLTTGDVIAGQVRGGIVLGGTGEQIRTNGIDYTGRLVITDEMQLLPVAGAAAAGRNANWEIVGANVGAGRAIAFNAQGGVSLTCGNNAWDTTAIEPRTTTVTSAWTDVAWNTSAELILKGIVRTDAAIANTTIAFGFKIATTNLDPTVGPDANQVYVVYSTNNFGDGTYPSLANWVVAYNIAGAGVTYINTGLAVAVDTDYRVQFIQNADRTVSVYINEVLEATVPALAAGITTMEPFFGVSNANTANNITASIRRITASRVYDV